MTNIENRNTTTQLKPINWEVHDTNCTLCITILQNSVKVEGSAKKKKYGRPSNNLIWTRAKTASFLEQIPNDILPHDYTLSSFPKELNPHLKLCMMNELQNSKLL